MLVDNAISRDQDVLYQLEGGIAVLTLNTPRKLNAWTEAMRGRLTEHITKAQEDPRVRGVVLTGAGEKGFCAGQDFAETAEFAHSDTRRTDQWIDQIEHFYSAIRSLSKPLVAALNGVAAGSGFQVALLADIRVGHDQVRLGQPEVLHGIPSITGTWLIAQHLGLSRATELVLSGRLMTATEAHDAGVLHYVVPAAQVVPAAVAQARQLADQPAGALAATKAWLRELSEPGFTAAFDAARRHHRHAYQSGEPQQAMATFLGRHAPATTS